ncbi:MAG: VanZ family protein [Chloroflexota bacterium]
MFRSLLLPHTIRWGVATIYTAGVLVYLLQQPGTPAVEVVAPVAAPDWQREITFTIGHILGFGGLFVVWWAALHPHISQRAIISAVVIAMTVGILAEVLQSRIPDRNASLYDIAMNSIGISLMALVTWRQHR